MAAADIEKLTARVSWIIGARGSAFDDIVNDDRFIQEEIRRALIETESEVVRTLCEAYHPMRNTFLAWSADLANGAQIPAHYGQVEAVQIKPYAAAGSYVLGEATSRDNIRAWRTNTALVFDALAHDVNGSALSGYYNITNQTLTFTGNVAQVKICTYTPNYATPALQIDDSLDTVIVAGTIVRLNKLGVPQALIMTYGSLYTNQIQMLRGGMTQMPELPDAQAIQ